MKSSSIFLVLFFFMSCCFAQVDSVRFVLDKANADHKMKLYKQSKFEYSKAESMADKLIKADSNNKRAYFYRGIAKTNLNMYDYYDFDKAIKLGLKDKEAYYYRGATLCDSLEHIHQFSMKDVKQEMSDFNMAIKMDSTYPEPYFYRARLWDSFYMDSISKHFGFQWDDPNRPDSMLNLQIHPPKSVDLMVINDYARGLHFATDSSEDNRNYWNLAVLKESIGDIEGACAAYKKLIELNIYPDNVNASLRVNELCK